MRQSLGARAGRATALTLGLALALAGCSKKVTSVDKGYTTPEGAPSANSQLVVTEDRPVLRYFYADFSPPGPSPSDVLDSISVVRKSGPGALHMTVFDGTPATGYQLFRREAGGGLRLFTDYIATPIYRWLDRGWEVYSFDDPAPTKDIAPGYQARGIVSSAATEHSPLSNAASLLDTGIVDLRLRVVTGFPPQPWIDSLFTVRWDAVPGAANYYLHVYQFRPDLRTETERVLAAAPAPLFIGKSKDYYAARIPAPATEYTLGQAGADVLTRRTTFFNQVYLARLAAVDANGRLIGYSFGDLRLGSAGDEYTIQSLGAISIATSRLPPESKAGKPRVELPLSARTGGRPMRLITVGEGPDALRILHFED